MEKQVEILVTIDFNELERFIEEQGGPLKASGYRLLRVVDGSKKQRLFDEAFDRYANSRGNYSAIYRELKIETELGYSLRQFTRILKDWKK
jgi:hypothetical protein